MYKVLLIDDEPWVLAGLELLIDWAEYGFEVVGKVKNGNEAWDYIVEHNPEVIVSDIRMPGLGGLSLLEKMRDAQLDTKVVLISGYSEFEYARKALKLGAFDYLVKPVEKTELISILKKLKKVLDTQKESLEDSEGRLEYFFELLSFNSEITVQQFIAQHNLDAKHSKYIMIYARNLDMDDLEGICGSGQIGSIGYGSMRVGKDDYIALIGFDVNDYEKVFDAIGKLKKKNPDEKTYVGASHIADSGEKFRRLYETSQIVFFSEVLFFTDEVRLYEKPSYRKEVMKLINQLGYAFGQKDEESVSAYLDEIKEVCKERKFFSDEIHAIYNEIAKKCNDFYDSSPVIERMNYRWFIGNFKDIEDVFGSLKSSLKGIEEVNDICENSLVSEVMEELQNEYTTNISLHQMAEKRNISQGYLSNLIKRATGMTFSQHLTRFRINKSKEILLKSDLTILEIAENIGYSDYYYFTKVFKKEVGITPFQFRKTNKAG